MRLAWPAIFVTAALLMLRWTWQQWPDVIVDSGHQLYVPWRLVEGDALYRDVESYSGPLTPFVNAGWMRLFGTSVMALVAGNLAVLAAVVALLFDLASRVADRLAAGVVTLAFVLGFAFAQHVGIGNYNHAFPYSHEMTHGLLLGLVALRFAAASIEPREGNGWRAAAWSAACGLAIGAAFLTRPEPFVPALAAALAVLVLGSSSPRSAAARMAPFASAVVPAMVAVAVLARSLGWSRAVQVVLRPIRIVVEGDVAALPFYREGLGLSDPADSARTMSSWLVAFVAVLVPLAWVGTRLRQRDRLRLITPPLAAIVVGILALLRLSEREWMEVARPLPLIMLLAGVATGAAALRASDGATRARWALACGWVVLGGAFLLKMALKARIAHYGFVLAMPATLALIFALVAWVPRAIESRGGEGRMVRWPALVLVLLGSLAYLRHQGRFVRAKTLRVEGAHAAGDVIMSDGRGAVVRRMLEEIEQRVPADATLMAVPDGSILSYLSRRPSSAPYTNLQPTEFVVYGGEEAVLARVMADPPDWICLVAKNAPEIGQFGVGYGVTMARWIHEEYESVALAGASPEAGRGFGIRLMRRFGREPFTAPTDGLPGTASTPAP